MQAHAFWLIGSAHLGQQGYDILHGKRLVRRRILSTLWRGSLLDHLCAQLHFRIKALHVHLTWTTARHGVVDFVICTIV